MHGAFSRSIYDVFNLFLSFCIYFDESQTFSGHTKKNNTSFYIETLVCVYGKYILISLGNLLGKGNMFVIIDSKYLSFLLECHEFGYQRKQ